MEKNFAKYSSGFIMMENNFSGRDKWTFERKILFRGYQIVSTVRGYYSATVSLSFMYVIIVASLLYIYENVLQLLKNLFSTFIYH